MIIFSILYHKGVKMLEKIILINKFYRDFCFSNKLIACHWFSEDSFFEVEKILNGEVELSDNNYSSMKKLFLNNKSETELLALEYVINNLLCDLRSCKFELEKSNT
jgi:hypothetical protein